MLTFHEGASILGSALGSESTCVDELAFKHEPTNAPPVLRVSSSANLCIHGSYPSGESDRRFHAAAGRSYETITKRKNRPDLISVSVTPFRIRFKAVHPLPL